MNNNNDQYDSINRCINDCLQIEDMEFNWKSKVQIEDNPIKTHIKTLLNEIQTNITNINNVLDNVIFSNNDISFKNQELITSLTEISNTLSAINDDYYEMNKLFSTFDVSKDPMFNNKK